MAITTKASFNFTNQIKTNHIGAYWRKKLFWAQLAFKIRKNFDGAPGDTVTVPYFGRMGAAEKPAENARVSVDSFGDQSFTGTVYEVAKAFGITDAGRVRMGVGNDVWEKEGFSQQARRMAEQVDSDCLDVIKATGSPKGHDKIRSIANFSLATEFSALKGIDTSAFQIKQANIRSVRTDLTTAFGDRNSECMAMVMHSQVLKDLEVEEKAGFLKADANDPFSPMSQYKGKLLSRATFELDNTFAGADITVTDSASATQKYKSWYNLYLKPDPYAIMIKKDPTSEEARDMLGRQDLFMATQWYVFTSLHSRIDSEDKRVAAAQYVTTEQTT